MELTRGDTFYLIAAIAFLFLGITASIGMDVYRVDPSPPSANNSSINNTYEPDIRKMIYNATRDERSARGLTPYQKNRSVETLANTHANDMATKGYFSISNNNGVSLDQRYETSAINCTNQTENIWRGSFGERPDKQTVVNQAMSEWMGSSTSKNHILSTEYAFHGVGVATEDGDEDIKVYIVQDLCGGFPAQD